jgi:hypothetical protein
MNSVFVIVANYTTGIGGCQEEILAFSLLGETSGLNNILY